MKGDIKKLAVFAMIAAMAMFTGVATASAWWPGRNSLWGQYAVTGGGACIAADGFVPDIFLANNPQAYTPDVMEGVYTFYPNGTGTFKGTLAVLIQVQGAPTPVLLGGSADFTWDFHYTVTDDGKISFTNYQQHGTWTSGPNTGCSFTGDNGPTHGQISNDGYVLTVTCGPGVTPPNRIINSVTSCPGPPPTTSTSQLLCIVNLVGQRR